MDDRKLVLAFISYLREHGFPSIEVSYWPEDHTAREIEAVAEPFAIEVTSIDTILNQRRDAAWFSEVYDGLRQELSGKIPFRIYLDMDYGSIKPGQNWPQIRIATKKWLINQAKHLPFDQRLVIEIPEVPFLIHVIKRTSKRPGVIFGYRDPKDRSLSHRFRELLDRKIKKLVKYHDAKKTTVILIDNWDFQLMNHGIMFDAFLDAYPDQFPQKLDQFWYADSTTLPKIDFLNLTDDLRESYR